MDSNARTAINDLRPETSTQQYQLQNGQSYQNYDDSNEHLGETNVQITSMNVDETQRTQVIPYNITEQAMTGDFNDLGGVNDVSSDDMNDFGDEEDKAPELGYDRKWGDGDMNDFEDEEDKAPESGYDRKRYMEIVRAEHFNNPRCAIFYELRDYKFPERNTEVDNTKAFIYIHHYRFNDNLSKPIEQKILKFYPAGLERTKRNTIIKDRDGNEIVSFIIGSENVRNFKEYRCYPVDYQMSELKGGYTLDKTNGLSRIHAIIQGIDSVIIDKKKPMKVIDVSNALGFLIKRAEDLEIYASTCLKAPSRGLIMEVMEANSEWITINTRLDELLTSKVINVKDSTTGEWTILDATTNSEAANLVEISPYNPNESAALSRADSPNMLGWLVYNANTKRWYIRSKRNPKEVSGLWLKSKNDTTHDFGDQYTLYHGDYLLIHTHLFTITHDYDFDIDCYNTVHMHKL